jgi:HK97 family phage major capsid protein
MNEETLEKKTELLMSKIDKKIEEANSAAIEAAKTKGEEAANELSEKQKELHGEIKSLVTKFEEAQKEIEDSRTEVDKLKGELEKAGSFGSTDSYQKEFKEKAEQIKALVNKDLSKSAKLEIKFEDFFQKATMTTGGSLENRRVIPYDRVINSPVHDPEETPLRNYFQSGTTSADTVEWPIEQVPNSSPQENWDYDNNAAAVDSDNAAAKPESEFQWDLETRNVRDIAHLVRLHKNLMNDLPLLQSYLPNRLRDGLNREVSRQILLGADGSQELIGLSQTGSHVDFDVAGFQAAVVNNNKTVPNANFIDILGYANTQLRLNNYNLTSYLINPADFYTLAFTVNDDGDYLMNTPNWRMIADKVIQSTYVTSDKFYAFDRRANTILSRNNVNVEFSYEDRDNFQKNLVTIRAEERAVQITDRPNGIVYGDFSDAIAT